MKLSTFQRAQKIAMKIKDIDKTLLYLRGVVTEIKDQDNDEIYIQLSNHEVRMERPVDTTSEGTYNVKFSFFEQLASAYHPVPLPPKKDKSSLPIRMNEVCAMEIIGVIARYMQEERQILIEKLSRMGIKIDKQ